LNLAKKSLSIIKESTLLLPPRLSLSLSLFLSLSLPISLSPYLSNSPLKILYNTLSLIPTLFIST
jgi:hypothetical protein